MQVRNGLLTARHPLAAAILATGVVQPFATTIGGGGLLTAVGPDGRGIHL